MTAFSDDIPTPPSGGSGTPRRRPVVGTAWAAWTAAVIVVAIALLSTISIGRQGAAVSDNGSAVAGNQGLSGSGQASGDTSAGAQGTSGDQGGTSGGSSGATGASGGARSGTSRIVTGHGGAAVAAGTGAGAGVAGGAGGAAGPGGGGSGGSAGGPAAPRAPTANLQCAAGKNGDQTDTGVSGNEIKLAATVVKSGVGSAFLGDVEYGMIAEMNKVNHSGGICGRQLSLKLVDDGWSASTGQQDIRTFIDEGYFALAVVPSSEGLRKSIDSGDIDRAGIPVVGTDGMLVDQYTDQWVWPVATSTNSLMHIMAKNAYDRGARSFGIVYDQNYRFGVEGDAAFKGAIQRLGGTLKAEVGIQAGQTSYSTDVNNRFNNNCSDCDFVALLLEPETAATWIKDGGYLGTSGKAVGAAGPQTLFTDGFGSDFAHNCPQPCNANFWVWTGFKPPQPPFDSDPAVQQYVNDLNAENSQADHDNQFVEGGYDGMGLLVKALQQVGPGLTRQSLRQALDATTYDSGLAPPRSYQPGHHFANVSAEAFSIVLNQQDFAGWRYQQTGFIADPWVGQDIAQ